MIGRPVDLTPEQLEARIRYHESTASMYESRGQPAAAKRFMELANIYRAELDSRAKKRNPITLE